MHNNVMGSTDDKFAPRRKPDYNSAPRCRVVYNAAHNIILY